MRHQEIIDFITRFPGRDDDEISAALQISPRQTINQICRKLEKAGLIERGRGSSGKIVNHLTPQSSAMQASLDRSHHTPADTLRPIKPILSVETLLGSGFVRAARWTLDEGGLLIASEVLPKGVGVYAFGKDGVVMYVGVATMGLAKRLYFYAKPGVSQRTSLRLNEVIKTELAFVPHIDILIATPEDMEWNGLPIHGAAGLELGIIKKFALPWNMRSAG
jgi:DNA-binding MarR family transcriptional regulator